MLCKTEMFVILDLIINMEDDTKLKIIFYVLVGLYSITIIGIWESFIKPFWIFFIKFLKPFLFLFTN